MTKYRVYPVLIATCTAIEVEADSKKEALEKAELEFDPPCICHQCSHEIDLGDMMIHDEIHVEEI